MCCHCWAWMERKVCWGFLFVVGKDSELLGGGYTSCQKCRALRSLSENWLTLSAENPMARACDSTFDQSKHGLKHRTFHDVSRDFPEELWLQMMLFHVQLPTQSERARNRICKSEHTKWSWCMGMYGALPD